MQPAQLHDPRVAMAAERTLLAWVRTSLAMMGFGFIVAKFGLFLREIAAVKGMPLKPGVDLSLWIGGALVVLGVVVNVTTAIQHFRTIRRLLRGEPYEVSVWSAGVVVAITIAILGLVLTAYLCFWSR